MVFVLPTIENMAQAIIDRIERARGWQWDTAGDRPAAWKAQAIRFETIGDILGFIDQIEGEGSVADDKLASLTVGGKRRTDFATRSDIEGWLQERAASGRAARRSVGFEVDSLSFGAMEVSIDADAVPPVQVRPKTLNTSLNGIRHLCVLLDHHTVPLTDRQIRSGAGVFTGAALDELDHQRSARRHTALWSIGSAAAGYGLAKLDQIIAALF